MNEQEFFEKLQHEAILQSWKNAIDHNPYCSIEQKEYYKQRLDIAAQQADQFLDLMKLLHQMGLLP